MHLHHAARIFEPFNGADHLMEEEEEEEEEEQRLDEEEVREEATELQRGRTLTVRKT